MRVLPLAAAALLPLFAQTPAAPVAPPAPRNPLAAFSDSIRTLTARAAPAVVEIQVASFGPGESEHGQASTSLGRHQGTGSGVIIDPAGYIVTNAHVVENATSVKVVLAGRRAAADPDADTRVVPARILGIDKESDVALIKIEGTALPTLAFAPPRSLRQGDLVLAIGSPLGLRNSVSFGVVSATSRAVSETSPLAYIQTDASINPGNSGGALIDMEGRLVGINTFIYTQSGGNEGIGFAIPSPIVQAIIHQLRTRGRIERAEVGLFLQDITAPLAAGLGLPRQRGVVVSDVGPETPAEQAGIQREDILLQVDGHPVRSVRQFAGTIYRTRPGQKVEIALLRGDQQLKATVTARARTAEADPLSALVSPERNLIPRLGILCIEIDKKVAELLPGLRRQYGLIVAAKSPDGQAQFLDLQAGDIIHALNKVPMASLDALRSSIAGMKDGDAAVLQIEREGRFLYVAFEID